MSTVYSMLCYNGQNTGSFFDLLSTEEKARYGDPGTYRCYSSLRGWITARSAVSTIIDTEHLEIADAFNDSVGTSTAIVGSNFKSYSIVIETRVKGDRSSAFHGGNVNDGYKVVSTGDYMTMLLIERSDVIVDGINLYARRTSVQNLLAAGGARQTVRNCISTSKGGIAYRLQGTASDYYSNIGFDSYTNFLFDGYTMNYSRFYNNLSAKGDYGMISGQPANGNYFNNISLGCSTTNWSAPPERPNQGGMLKNAGPSGSSPWGTESITSVTPADFVDYANNDFRIVSNSVLRDIGHYFLDLFSSDIIGVFRPNYSAGEQALDAIDLGPFEYDSGNGLAPTQVHITVANLIAASTITIETLSGAVILLPVIIAGTTHSFDYPYTGDLAVILKVRNRRNGNWQPYEQVGVITNAGCNFYVSQVGAIV